MAAGAVIIDPMPDAVVRIRPNEPSDRESAVLLAARLETGVAGWRDTGAVRRAVIGWIESSLENAVADDAGDRRRESRGPGVLRQSRLPGEDVRLTKALT
jgi:hypothetical protein